MPKYVVMSLILNLHKNWGNSCSFRIRSSSVALSHDRFNLRKDAWGRIVDQFLENYKFVL